LPLTTPPTWRPSNQVAVKPSCPRTRLPSNQVAVEPGCRRNQSRDKLFPYCAGRFSVATLAVRSLVLSASLTCLAFSGPFVTGRAVRQSSTGSSLTAHEWGTFTSIAGRNGQAVRWFPLNGSDLPRFVEHFRTADFKVGLSGTIRLETPGLYFYAPSKTTVSVKVSFPRE
jgi:hypothetical protein